MTYLFIFQFSKLQKDGYIVDEVLEKQALSCIAGQVNGSSFFGGHFRNISKFALSVPSDAMVSFLGNSLNVILAYTLYTYTL